MRQGIALHAELRTRINPHEAICFDGLVNFDASQFFPTEHLELFKDTHQFSRSTPLLLITADRQRSHCCTHAERAGIARELITLARKTMFTVRAFLSRICLLPIDMKIWKKQVYDPKAGMIIQGYLPNFALQ